MPRGGFRGPWGGHRGLPKGDRNANALPHHPWIRQDKLSMMLRLSRDGNFDAGVMLHLNQAALILNFERVVHNVPEEQRVALRPPIGYHPFVHFFNSVPADQYKWRLAEYNSKTRTWILPEHRVIIALEQPFDNIHHRNTYYQRREEERATAQQDEDYYGSKSYDPYNWTDPGFGLSDDAYGEAALGRAGFQNELPFLAPPPLPSAPPSTEEPLQFNAPNYPDTNANSSLSKDATVSETSNNSVGDVPMAEEDTDDFLREISHVKGGVAGSNTVTITLNFYSTLCYIRPATYPCYDS
ncbi:hypothetical protein E4T56_gene13221 [Termitomyces sp. T112]|nr:hypothetical protein E4T56_gene13221 [Termitomyces sp. T112]